MKKNYLKIFLLIILILMIIGIAYLVYGYVRKANEVIQNPIVTMEIENYGTVKMELYPEYAPNTVANFVKLVQNGYYNGLTFHRVEKDFMIQGGDKKGDGTGKVELKDLYPEISDSDNKEYNIPGEFIANSFSKNKIRFEKGVLAMARADYSQLSSSLTEEGYNSAGSQFFIMTADMSNMNGYYAAFGKVIEGMDIVEKISELETKVETAEDGTEKKTSTPVETPVISSMTVDTFGVDYGNPTTNNPFDYTSWIMSNYGSNLNLK